jgi:hypothetical protein
MKKYERRKKVKNPDFAFAKGLSQVRQCDKKEILEKLSLLFGSKYGEEKGISSVQMYNRKNGYVEPTITEHQGVVAIFKEYGIKEVWGEA